ncbi:MAG: hypothetical protein ACOH5I_26650 [Oligoflexus sp.]
MREIDGSIIYRAAKFLPKTVSEEERTVDLVWTTGSRVLRVPWFDEPYFEELSVEDSSIRLQRLNGGAPLLDSHESRNLSDQIGVVLRSWIKGGKGHATVQFRSNAKSQEKGTILKPRTTSSCTRSG